MKNKFLSLALMLCLAFGYAASFTACSDLTGSSGNSTSSSAPSVEKVDYVSQVSLDLNSADTQKLEVNLKKYTHIDGDTTHFRGLTGDNIPERVEIEGVLKARYLAVNTPESTGEIEEWGKAASWFTKEKLASATSVVVESDGAEWATDSNGRFLVWVWYKPAGEDSYRNLNLELLQEGLALAANATGTRYGETCLKATMQAQSLKLYVFSKKKDPDYFYGAAIPTDLKSIRTNLEYYRGKRVAITATVTVAYDKGSIYIEDLDNAADEETGLYYGMPVFYGMGNLSWGNILAPGNRVFLVGEVSYSEGWGYQICNLKYNQMRPDAEENIRIVGEAGTALPSYKETSLADFLGNVTVTKEAIDEETGKFKVDEETGEVVMETATFSYAELALSTSVLMKNLKVVDVYTTSNGESEGAMTLTCQDDKGNEIDVRTAVLYKDADKTVLATATDFMGKTIDVKAIVDYYKNQNSAGTEWEDESPYQLKVFNFSDIVIK